MLDLPPVACFNTHMSNTPEAPNPLESPATTSSSGEAISQRVREVAARLHRAICGVVDQIPVAAEGPQAFARELGVHKALANKVLSAARLADPIAVLKQLPRSEGLGIFLRAAKPSVSAERVRNAEAAISELQTVVKRDLGGWDELDVAIGSWLPEARAEAELTGGRQVYNGLRNILGVTADVQLSTVIIYPNSDGENCDAVLISASLGLRRLRPRKEIPVESIGIFPRQGQASPPGSVTCLSESQAPDGLPLLESFCSTPLPPFRLVKTGKVQVIVMSGDAFGVRSGVDLCFGVATRGVRPLYRPESDPDFRVPSHASISIPVKKLVFNVLLEDSVYPRCEPELALYQTHERGSADPNDPARQIDRMETTASVQYLGRGPHSFHVAEFARHAELVQYACDKLGWDINRLRGYRCRVQYPVAVAQYSMLFEPPVRAARD